MTSALVRIQYSAGGVEQRTLADGVYTIGRDSGDIVLADPDVSAVHARLEVRIGQVWATDLGSTNGTLGSNNQRINPGQLLRPGEFIRLGSSSITVVTGAQAGGTRSMAQIPDIVALSPRPSVATIIPVAPSAPLTRSSPSSEELFAHGKRVLCRSGHALKVSLSAYSATHVSGGGSTTTVGPSGHAQTAHHRVTSHVTHHTLQELWLRTPEGRDMRFQLRDANVDVLEGHRLSVLMTPGDERALRIVNHSTGYYYSIEVFRSTAARVVWDRFWPFIIGAFMAMPCLSLLFAIGAPIEAFSRNKGWACSSPLLKLIALGAIGALLFTLARRARHHVVGAYEQP